MKMPFDGLKRQWEPRLGQTENTTGEVVKLEEESARNGDLCSKETAKNVQSCSKELPTLRSIGHTTYRKTGDDGSFEDPL